MFVKIGRKARINVDEISEYDIHYSEGYGKWYLTVYFRNSEHSSPFTCGDEHEAYEMLAKLDVAVGLSPVIGEMKLSSSILEED